MDLAPEVFSTHTRKHLDHLRCLIYDSIPLIPCVRSVREQQQKIFEFLNGI